VTRLLAVDWSGRSGRDQIEAIVLAEAANGQLIRLERGRTRAEVVDHLIAEAERGHDLIVGLDFAFSLPAWYLRERGLSPRELWAALAAETLTPAMRRLGLARWMSAPEPPFWTTAAGHAALGARLEFRRTELEVRSSGVRPQSPFKLVGAGQVGRGSLYGMQALHRLAASGFGVWPFDPPGRPLVLEIFPRLLTGAVNKSSERERRRHLARLALPDDLRRLAAASEDAFDAAVSALAMARAHEDLSRLRHEPAYGVEGRIWQ
jgi:hypothetical protein